MLGFVKVYKDISNFCSLVSVSLIASMEKYFPIESLDKQGPWALKYYRGLRQPTEGVLLLLYMKEYLFWLCLLTSKGKKKAFVRSIATYQIPELC